MYLANIPKYVNAVDFGAKCITTRKKRNQSSGVMSDYSLRWLPFHDRYLNTPVEPMHLLKNISEQLVKLLSGLTDTMKVRMDEKACKRFRGTLA